MCIGRLACAPFLWSLPEDGTSVSKHAAVYAYHVYFFLNNLTNVLIIQIYSVIKLYMFRAYSLPIIRGFLLYIRHW
jgi:hypothetical protein